MLASNYIKDEERLLKLLDKGYLWGHEETKTSTQSDLSSAISRYYRYICNGERKKFNPCKCGILKKPYEKYTDLNIIDRLLFFHLSDQPWIFLPEYALLYKFLLYDLGHVVTSKRFIANKDERLFNLFVSPEVIGTEEEGILVDEGAFGNIFFSKIDSAEKVRIQIQNNQIQDSLHYSKMRKYLFDRCIRENRDTKKTEIRLKIYHVEDCKEVVKNVWEKDADDKVCFINVKERNVNVLNIVKEKIAECEKKQVWPIFVVDLLWGTNRNTGVDLIREIRRFEIDRKKLIKPMIIVYSAYNYPVIISKCYALNVDYIIIKGGSHHSKSHGHHGNLDLLDSENILSRCVLLWCICEIVRKLEVLKQHLKTLNEKNNYTQILECVGRIVIPGFMEGIPRKGDILHVPYCIRSYVEKALEYIYLHSFQDSKRISAKLRELKNMLEI